MQAFWGLESLCSKLHTSVSVLFPPSLYIVMAGRKEEEGHERSLYGTKEQVTDSIFQLTM